jgi:hypothetical protein
MRALGGLDYRNSLTRLLAIESVVVENRAQVSGFFPTAEDVLEEIGGVLVTQIRLVDETQKQSSIVLRVKLARREHPWGGREATEVWTIKSAIQGMTEWCISRQHQIVIRDCVIERVDRTRPFE